MTRRRRTLSEDDLAVWRQVAKTANPLEKNSFSTTRLSENSAPDPEPQPIKSETANGVAGSPQKFRIGETAADQVGHTLLPTIQAQLAQQPLKMDARTFGKLKRGKLRPERKLDLHGMTLAQAHPVLNRFIQSAFADGLRLVVVITGKGRSGRDEGGPIPTPRGVLRHQVPGWLNAPGMRALVLQVTDAHARHGGAGAYYVYLRRGR
ncbi:MAG: Smr/MutS family protein [Pseudomonadota bacterium]